MKNYIKLLLKFVLAFGLVYWLVDSGKLNFGLLKEVFIKYPERPVLAFLGTILVLFLVAYRYRYIIEYKSNTKIPFFKVFKYNWIGMFFNSVLPGSVSGDLVKIFYIKQEDNKLTNKFLLASILIDRVVFKFVLNLVLGIFTIINYQTLSLLSNNMKNILDINLILFAGVILSLMSLFFFQTLPHKIAKPFERVPILEKIIPQAKSAWDDLCNFKHRMLWLTGISIIIQVSAILLFWYIVAPFADGNFPFQYAFSLIPIGLIAIAIPIAPSGLGVGHGVFHTLFGYIAIKNGADLFNIYFILVLCVNLIGAIPYFMSKSNKIDIKKLNNMNS